jgi:lipopolysaccharide transport system ATP-binding protein
MKDVAIKVENLFKRYRIGLKEETKDTLFGALGSILKSPFQNLKRLKKLTSFNENNNESDDIIWALKDISFEVKRGEVLGIIGPNGAGKSTLLKILAQITYPTSGRVELNGRVASLLEVGTGFHPELTGRENIYLNGTILGMTKKEIDSKLDEIVEFSGVEKFIDTPAKRYSNGMRVRLAFSVAAHLDPEILLIDEVLAVGDAEFQKKCLGKMEQVSVEGRTVLFVSHNMSSIIKLCPSSILLEYGRITETGSTEKVVEAYLDTTESISCKPLEHREDRTGNGLLKFTNLSVGNVNGEHIFQLQPGMNVEFKINYHLHSGESLSNVVVFLQLNDLYDQPIFNCISRVSNSEYLTLFPHGEITCSIDYLPLLPGRYYIDICCKASEGIADWVKRAGVVEVVPNDVFGTGKLPTSGKILTSFHWSTKV